MMMEIRGIADPFQDGGPRHHRGPLRRSGTGSLSEVLVAEVPLRVLEFRLFVALVKPKPWEFGDPFTPLYEGAFQQL